MPKREHSTTDEFEEISRKMRKLERKLNRARRRRGKTKSSQESSPSLDGSQPEGEALDDDASKHDDDDASKHDDDDASKHENPNECDQGGSTNANGLPHNFSPDNAVINLLEEEGDSNTLDTDILEILGDDPTLNKEHGPDLHKEIAGRLEHLATCGLSREQRKELQEKYPLPNNAVKLGAPVLNNEIKAALSEVLINRDKAIEAKQKLLGSAISCLGATLSKLLESKENKNVEILSKVMDATRILCDVQHCDSTTRRKFCCSLLKKDIKDQVLSTKIDKYLFGETLLETLRAAKAVSKSGAEIKTYQPSAGSKTKQKPNIPTKNWKTPPARRPPAPQGRQENREPAYRPNQPGKPFKRSPYPPKPPRRR